MRLKHQANIRAFGGNPDRVLLSGESAGGASVINHLARPNSRGLFAAAIQESGGYEFIQGEANASKFNADFKKVLDANRRHEWGSTAPRALFCVRRVP